MNSALPEDGEKAVVVRSMFDRIAPRYDMVNRVMTFRMDVGWRRKAVDSLGLTSGSVVLDLACGTGDFCNDLDRAGLEPLGVDVSLGMLQAARTPSQLVLGDALGLPVRDASVDGATCGFALRNFVSLPPFFEELARCVRPGGRIAILEVDEPKRRLLRTGHQVYFGKVVPFIGGVLSDKDAYRYLPESLAYLPPEAELLDMVRAAGFEHVTKQQMRLGVAQLITATRA